MLVLRGSVMPKAVVRRIEPPDLAASLQVFGALDADASIFLAEGIDQWIRIKSAQPISPRLQATLRGEAIVIYQEADDAGRAGRNFLLGGTRGAFQAVLRRWPDEADWRDIGTAIGAAFSLPVDFRAETRFAGRGWNWGERTFVMGILNLTPDSFSDGGRLQSLDMALQEAE